MPNLELKKFTYGVRFKHAFRLNDISGEIIDKILYKSSYFSPKEFANVSRDGNGFLLFNQADLESHDVFRMVATDLIFTHTLLKDEKLESVIDQYTSVLKNFFAPEIIEKYDLITERLGIVYQSKMDSQMHKNVSGQFFTRTFDDSFEYRFSKQDVVPNSSINAKKSDYISKLFSSSRLKDNNHMFSYDYQHFFVPNQAYISDKVERIIKDSYSAYKRDIVDIEV